MERLHLGEFEEIVLLTVAVLDGNAYGISIKDDIEERLNRKVSVGAMRTALNRLEKKGFVESYFGEATKTRGGKRKRYFVITSFGRKAIENAKDTRQLLWDAMPSVSFIGLPDPS